ncbi:MAG: type II toxin-antitoxin system prevent-host-death family antitoxin [Acetobacteraceae bacterium]|nr:type II toxin-antitoxin system prevent-host-death family antitoxin [Acetobacteraceae bacterium]
MSPVKHPDRAASGPADTAVWKLEDAKARFSEVVRLAEQGVPQHVNVRGRPAVVIVSAPAYARLAPAASGSLAALFGEGPFTRLDDFDDVLARDRTPMRDPETFEP